MEEALHTVGFSVKLWLVNIVGFLLLLAMLRQWLWRPLKTVIESRAERIANQLAEAERKMQEAAQVRAEADEYAAHMRAEAEQQRDAILREANQQAEQIVAQARDEASQLRRQARADAQQLKLKALEQAKREAAELGAAMAERLLKNVLDEERQRAVLEATIADLEAVAGDGSGGDA